MTWYGNCPVDTGPKFNVHKTFRRRPEHLLNVLCTFNLRPVSTGCAFINKIIMKYVLKKNSGEFYQLKITMESISNINKLSQGRNLNFELVYQ